MHEGGTLGRSNWPFDLAKLGKKVGLFTFVPDELPNEASRLSLSWNSFVVTQPNLINCHGQCSKDHLCTAFC